MEQQVDRHSFQRVLGRTDVLALSIGTMIGWGWLALSGYWVATGGVAGSVAAFILGAIIFILIGNVYAELAAALPVAGGEIAFSYRALGYYFSVFVGWTITFAYIGVAAWEGVAISTALAYLFPDISFPWVLIGVIGAIGVTLLNYFGPRPATIFQVIITSAMMLSGFLFFFTSVSFGDIANAEPFFTDSWGMITVLLIVPSMLLGFDIIPPVHRRNEYSTKADRKIVGFFHLSLFHLVYPDHHRSFFGSTDRSPDGRVASCSGRYGL
jgi:Amino acid transporters